MVLGFGRRLRKFRLLFIEYGDCGCKQLRDAAYSNAESIQLQDGFVYYELEASIISVSIYVDDIVKLYAKDIETADAFVFVFDHSSKASATFIERALQQVVAHKETSRFAFVVLQSSVPNRTKHVSDLFGDCLALAFGGEFISVSLDESELATKARALFQLALQEITTLRKIEKQIRCRRLEGIENREKSERHGRVSDELIANVFIMLLLTCYIFLSLPHRRAASTNDNVDVSQAGLASLGL